MRGRASCCILSYRNIQFLFETIDSVLSQEYENIEIIVHDDGTENFPLDSIKSYIDEKKSNNIKNVIVFSAEKNVGTVKNYNNAIKKSTGDYILPVSCGDILFDESVVSKVVDAFESSGVDLISFRRLLCEEKGLDPIRFMPTDEDINKIKLLNTSELQYKAFAGIGSYYEMASGASVCYRKKMLQDMEYFDEEYRLWEDGTFFTRYSRVGKVVITRFDITYIKYRKGGISTNRTRKSATSMQLKADSAKLFEKEVLPYRGRFSSKEFRVLRAKYFLNKHCKLNKIVLGLLTVILYPDCLRQL